DPRSGDAADGRTPLRCDGRGHVAGGTNPAPRAEQDRAQGRRTRRRGHPAHRPDSVVRVACDPAGCPGRRGRYPALTLRAPRAGRRLELILKLAACSKRPRCEAAPESRTRAVLLYGERTAEGANEADGPLSAG